MQGFFLVSVQAFFLSEVSIKFLDQVECNNNLASTGGGWCTSS